MRVRYRAIEAATSPASSAQKQHALCPKYQSDLYLKLMGTDFGGPYTSECGI